MVQRLRYIEIVKENEALDIECEDRSASIGSVAKLIYIRLTLAASLLGMDSVKTSGTQNGGKLSMNIFIEEESYAHATRFFMVAGLSAFRFQNAMSSFALISASIALLWSK